MMTLVKTKTHGGISTEFLRAVSTYNETGLIVDYPYTEEALSQETKPQFYLDLVPPFPASPEPANAMLHTAFNKGATMQACSMLLKQNVHP